MNIKCKNSYLPSYTTLKIFIRLEHIFKVAAFMYLKPSSRSITKYIQNVLAVQKLHNIKTVHWLSAVHQLATNPEC